MNLKKKEKKIKFKKSKKKKGFKLKFKSSESHNPKGCETNLCIWPNGEQGVTMSGDDWNWEFYLFSLVLFYSYGIENIYY